MIGKTIWTGELKINHALKYRRFDIKERNNKIMLYQPEIELNYKGKTFLILHHKIIHKLLNLMTNEIDTDNDYFYFEDYINCVEDKHTNYKELLEAFITDYNIPIEIGLETHKYRGESFAILTRLLDIPFTPADHSNITTFTKYGQRIIDYVQQDSPDYDHFVIGKHISHHNAEQSYFQLIRDKSIIEGNIKGGLGRYPNLTLCARHGIDECCIQPMPTRSFNLNNTSETWDEIEKHLTTMLDVLETWDKVECKPRLSVHYDNIFKLRLSDRNRLEQEYTQFFL